MKSKVSKEAREWIILIAVGGFIYFMGWHTAIIGTLQRAVLATGIISPSQVEGDRFASFDFKLEGLDQSEVDFSKMKGEVVFVNFWATWCPPCIAEMPDIHNLYEETGGDIQFVMISLDKGEEKARKYIADKNFQFPVYFLRSGLPSTYQVQSIPTTYLIDRDGKIHVENHGMAKYNTESFRGLIQNLAAANSADLGSNTTQ